jgi:PAS domain S-box-containing protein
MNNMSALLSLRQQAEQIFEQRAFVYPESCVGPCRTALRNLAIEKIMLEIQHQQLLQESEILYHTETVGYIFLNKMGVIIKANPIASKLCNLTDKQHELLALYLPEAARAEFNDHLKQVFASRKTEIYTVQFEDNYLRFESRVYLDNLSEDWLCCTVVSIVSNEDKQNNIDYKQLFNKNNAICLLTEVQDGRIVDANQAACEYYGYTLQQLKKLYIHNINILSVEYIQREMYLARVQRRNQFYFRHKLANGEIKDVEVYVSPIKINGKEYLYSIVHDISAWRETERLLHEIQEKLLETQQIGQIGYWELELESGNMYWEAQMYRIFGLEKEIIGHESDIYQQPISPKNYEYVRRIAEHAIRSPHKQRNIEYKIYCSDNKLRYIRANWHITHTADQARFVGAIMDITELRQTQLKLKESELRFYNMFEYSGAGIALLDSSGNFKLINPALSRILGYEQSNLFNKNLFNISHSEEISSSQEYIDNLLNGKINQFQLERRYIHQHGYEVWTIVSASIVRDENYKPIYLILQIQDIAKQKQVEQALRRSEQRFNLAVQGSREGIWDWDILSNSQYYSPRFKQILGYKIYEMPHNTNEWRRRLHPDDYEWVLSRLNAYLKHELPVYELTYRVQHKDGYYVWVLDRGIAVWNEQGQAVRMVGTYTDLTEQKQAEMALKQSESRFKAIFNNATVGISLLDLNGKYIQINGIWSKMLNYSNAEAMTKSFIDVTYKDDINKSCHYFNKILAQEVDNYRIEKRFVCRNGEIFWADLWVSAIKSDTEVVAILQIMVDLNERKQAEATLQTAKELAEMANLAKTVFLANMSHELRTPLNAILGYTQILTQDEQLRACNSGNKTIYQEYKHGIDIIHRNAEYLLAIINDILDLSKIEAGKFELQPNDFNLNELINDINHIFSNRATEKRINYNYNILNEIPSMLYGDSKCLRQIIINLLSNAIKYTAEGGEVEFKLAYNNEQIKISIADTGIGIEKKDIQRIFEPFQQAGSDYYRLKGTGLGLSITQKLLKVMGGSITVDTSPGLGSTFNVIIPMARAENFTLNPIANERINTSITTKAKFNLKRSGLSAYNIKDLYDFANMGDVQGLLNYIDELAQEQNTNKEYLQYLRGLAEDIECEKICTILQNH